MSAFEEANKYAVVTGGASWKWPSSCRISSLIFFSGITLEFVRLLLAKGTPVLVGDLELRPEAQELANAYPTTGETKFIFQKTDVTSWPQLSSLWKTVLQEFPQVDLVLPGADVYEPPFSSFWLPPLVWRDLPRLTTPSPKPASTRRLASTSDYWLQSIPGLV